MLRWFERRRERQSERDEIQAVPCGSQQSGRNRGADWAMTALRSHNNLGLALGPFLSSRSQVLRTHNHVCCVRARYQSLLSHEEISLCKLTLLLSSISQSEFEYFMNRIRDSMPRAFFVRTSSKVRAIERTRWVDCSRACTRGIIFECPSLLAFSLHGAQCLFLVSPSPSSPTSEKTILFGEGGTIRSSLFSSLTSTLRRLQEEEMRRPITVLWRSFGYISRFTIELFALPIVYYIKAMAGPQPLPRFIFACRTRTRLLLVNSPKWHSCCCKQQPRGCHRIGSRLWRQTWSCPRCFSNCYLVHSYWQLSSRYTYRNRIVAGTKIELWQLSSILILCLRTTKILLIVVACNLCLRWGVVEMSAGLSSG